MQIASSADSTGKTHILLSSIGFMLFAGIAHIWSVYQADVALHLGWSATMPSFCYYAQVPFFVAGSMLGGKLYASSNPGFALHVGCWGTCLGLFTSGLVTSETSFLMFVTYSGLFGLGSGFLYNIAIANAQRAFPDRLGFASGIVICMNGISGTLFAPICTAIKTRFGVAVMFQVLGLLAFLVGLYAMFVFYRYGKALSSNPSARTGQALCGYTSGEMLRTNVFYLMFFSMMFFILPYFAMVPIMQALQLENGVPAHIALMGLMVATASSAVSRLVFPALSDRIGRLPVLCMMAGILFVSCLMVAFSTGIGITIGILLQHVSYGITMSCYPAIMTELFGPKHSGENYGYMMASILVASFVALGISTSLSGQPLQSMFHLSFVFAILATVLLLSVFAQIKKGRFHMQRPLTNEESVRKV